MKEGQVGAGWADLTPLPGSGTITAMSIDGSRIGIVRGGTAYARDTSLGLDGRPASNGWQTIAYNALDIKLAGSRLAVLKTNRWVDMKDGALNSGWYPDVAMQVLKIVITPTRIGVLTTSGSFGMKEGSINGGWYEIVGVAQASDIALTDNWIGLRGAQAPYVDHFRATDVLQNNPPLSTMDTGVTNITMGGKGLDKRMGWIGAGGAKAKEEILGGQIVDLCSGIGTEVEVAVNSGRVATRTSAGNVYVYEGEGLGCGSLNVNPMSGVRLN